MEKVISIIDLILIGSMAIYIVLAIIAIFTLLYLIFNEIDK